MIILHPHSTSVLSGEIVLLNKVRNNKDLRRTLVIIVSISHSRALRSYFNLKTTVSFSVVDGADFCLTAVILCYTISVRSKGSLNTLMTKKTY